MRSTHRSLRRAALALGIAAASGALTLASAPASAQARAAEASDAQGGVEALVQRGIELRRDGQDEEALRAFEAAEAKDPSSVRVRVHLAATHQALGHWLQADTYLEQVLRAEDDPYVRRHRQTLEKAAEFVARHVGSLEVSGSPEGAEVRIDGRQMGVLPLASPLRLAVGSYQLEVARPGYYPARRPVVIGERAAVRESVELARRPAEPAAAAPMVASRGSRDAPADDRADGPPRWLSWTLTGLATGAALTTGVAFALREAHADRWNSDDCQELGRVRGEVCPGELARGRDAERVGYVSGVATLLLGAGAVVSWSMERPAALASSAKVTRCGVSWAGAACEGSF
jgi:hypothetical protein